ncbi:hypothetical protein IWZ00DRAFT_96136 [Phyllosticta capitalensis]
MPSRFPMTPGLYSHFSRGYINSLSPPVFTIFIHLRGKQDRALDRTWEQTFTYHTAALLAAPFCFLSLTSSISSNFNMHYPKMMNLFNV